MVRSFGFYVSDCDPRIQDPRSPTGPYSPLDSIILIISTVIIILYDDCSSGTPPDYSAPSRPEINATRCHDSGPDLTPDARETRV